MLGVRFPPPLPEFSISNITMARVKISEFQAKEILQKELGFKWSALQVNSNINTQTISNFFGSKLLVVKVDQGVKKRGKTGLMQTKIKADQAKVFIDAKTKLGYSQFIIEPFFSYSKDQEKYLCLERTRSGIQVIFNEKGGMDIEANWQNNQSSSKNPQIKQLITELTSVFDKYYFSYLEINPLVIDKSDRYILDTALEIDDLALKLPELALFNLEPVNAKKLFPSEQAVSKLDNNTPASLKYRVLNKDGAIWMLLSGGGASLVLADEVADLGYGRQLANYGEYSGNPTTSDTYLYTKIILTDLFKSRAKRKVLVIAGGVANFTDVAKTFTGIIQALKEYKTKLVAQKVKVFVRRGGPNEKQGLEMMGLFLKDNNLFGAIYGKQTGLTDVINTAVKHLS